MMLWLSILAVLILVATWLVVLLVHLPIWIAIVVTAVVIVALATVFVVRMIRAQMRSAALERELLRQAAAQAERVRPDKRPEILALQAQMKAALDTLKRSKLGKGGKSALYALPWYAIVGPPAAGKTTALSQSGLGFITPQGAGGAKVRGTAGTKNCDWWFSQHAILLDTAGRLSTEEDDHEEWTTFLDTLRRFRPERPLDGIVVALSVEDLLGATEDQNEELVRKLRQRVDELMGKTEMVLPIYIMFTKVDLIAGFVEFFADLGKAQRGQAWGASFSIDDERLDDPLHATETEFELLMKVLHSHMLERLAREPQPEVRQRVMQFPLEFQALGAPVARFVEELARQNPYQETPLVRGFYFSSGTQTGRAMDRVLANMARGFDLRGFQGQEQRPTQAQSFFVTDLFAKVIFPDRHLGMRSMSRVKRKNRQRAIWAFAAVLITLLIVAPATSSYVDNSDLMQAAERDVQQARTLERSGEASSAANALNLLLDRTEQLEREEAKTSVRGFYGPYTAKDLAASFGGIYVQRLRAMVEGEVQQQLTSDVRAVGDLMRTDIRNFQSAYEDLKLYVMLSQPKHLEQEFATKRLSVVWARALRSTSEGDQQRLEAHAARYVAGLAADPSWAWKPDSIALVRAQGKLSSLPIDELRFSWLNEAAQGAPPIRPEKIFFGASAQYWKTRGNVEVPGLYTKLGWEKVRPLLESPDARLELEPWVLGRDSMVEVDTRENAAERLRDLYFQRYVAAWSDFLAGLDVDAPVDMQGALMELRALSEAEGPYVRLFRTLGENTRLDITPASLLGKALDKGKQLLDKQLEKMKLADAGAPERPVSSVERHFQPLLKFAFGDVAPGKPPDGAPTGLAQYLVQLSTLHVSLSQLAESRAEVSNEFASELSRTAAAVQILLGGTDPRSRLILEPLLMNPIRGSRAGVVRADFASLSEHWKAEVWDNYNTKIQTRFPFANAQEEVTVPEFAEFFRPDTGILWKFYKANLENRLDRVGDGFAPKPSADPMPFRADFLSCLSVAGQITEAIFGTTPEPNLQFGIRIHPVSANIAEIALIVDGQPTVYRNEPERWAPVQWPGKGEPHGGTLQVKGGSFTDEVPRLGDFGLFRLLAAGGLKPSGQTAGGVPVLVATWNLTREGEPPVTIDFKPARTVHPFAREFFHRLRCPPEVTVGGGAAAQAAAGGRR